MLFEISKYFFLILRIIVFSLFLLIFIILPSYDYLKNQYMYYIKKKILIYNNRGLIEWIFREGKYISLEDYKNKWGHYPQKIVWYKYKAI